MLKYTYEELTSEEKQFIQYLQKNPIATCDTLIGDDYYRAAKKLTKGAKTNIILKCTFLLFTLIYGYALILNIKHSQDTILHIILTMIAGLMFYSMYKLGKGEFSKESLILQKEVQLQNIRVIEKTLYRNRNPLEITIIEETPKYFKIRCSTLNNKIEKLYKRERDEVSWRIIFMKDYYYIYYRFSILRLAHIKIRPENYKELNSEFLDMRYIEYEEEEITKESYERLVDESKSKEWYLREHFFYRLITIVLILPFVFLAIYELFSYAS